MKYAISRFECGFEVIMRAAVNAGLAEAYPGLPGAEGLPALAANMYR